jgi:rare lipoprotein A
MRTGKHIFVRITDRGPYIHGRMLDLSRAAARALGMLGSGVERVEATVFRPRKR